MIKQSLRSEFNCPRCGSTHFGSGMSNGVLTYFCHGRDGRCTFQAPDADAWKLFVQVQVMTFESAADYKENAS